ncbi:MAG: T9SS type A sorting domain-containing protein [Bacteroidia bacterium]|nr:T9SS type A sorting domain-containing protein [Bacteroidia bacterium]
MKKQLLILVAVFCFGLNQLFAQCNPDLSITTPGVFPDSLINLDTAMVGQPYTDTLQFKVYASVPPLIVDSVRIMSITGLPAGFITTSNPPGMSFAGGSNGCVLIQGTAPSTPATYPLIVNLRFYAHNPVPFIPVVIDTTDDDYRIVIIPFTGIAPINGYVFDVYQNFPNPFDLTMTTEINFTTPVAGKVEFKVFDLLGKEIIVRSIDAVPGLNVARLSSKYLKPGIYFYSITNRSKTITRKMIVTAKP